MNAPDRIPALQSAVDPVGQALITTLSRFNLEEFQNLTKADLLLAQAAAGHGGEWGVWKTPKTLHPGKLGGSHRTLNFEKRLRDCLAKEALPETSPELLRALVEEGVLTLTRLALLLRLAPTAGMWHGKTRRLKPSTLTAVLHAYLPHILARAILRKVARPDALGLFGCLTEDDVRELRQDTRLRIELGRLRTLATRGMWIDLPRQARNTHMTDPSGPKPKPSPEVLDGEWQPLPDAYLSEFGSRNLWLICELGPSLLSLLEGLAAFMESTNWSGVHKLSRNCAPRLVAKFIANYLHEHPWTDYSGKALRPAFPLMTSSKKEKDKFEWPPRTYGQLKVLSATLQSAQLFLTLLATAGRVGEIATLTRSCVTTERDGKDYVRGWTYKLSDNMLGDARQWPAPTVLVQAIGQQVRLANVWSRLPSIRLKDGIPTVPPPLDDLWISLGASPNANAAEPLASFSGILLKFAERIGMDPRPGGINLHPHRCRKTIGRLAGITLFNSPLVLKRLFGHKNIEMTLHYILCDKDIRTEAEAVLRELRIIHCAEALEEIREALAFGHPLPGYSGAAASRMVEAVKEHEARLPGAGQVWNDGSAYDLAYMLTSQGQGWRFIQRNIICAKVPGEGGLCRKNKGEPNTSDCKPGCDNRIVLALKRRDVGEIVESYIDVASQSLGECQHMVFYESMTRLLEELDAFPDLKLLYLADQRFQSLLTSYEEFNE